MGTPYQERYKRGLNPAILQAKGRLLPGETRRLLILGYSIVLRCMGLDPRRVFSGNSCMTIPVPGLFHIRFHNLPFPGRRIGLLLAPGDRQSVLAGILAAFFSVQGLGSAKDMLTQRDDNGRGVFADRFFPVFFI